MERQDSPSVTKIDLSNEPDDDITTLPAIHPETLAQAPDDAIAHLEKMLSICADVKYVPQFCCNLLLICVTVTVDRQRLINAGLVELAGDWTIKQSQYKQLPEK